MNDSNWKKLIQLSEHLGSLGWHCIDKSTPHTIFRPCKKLQKAVNSVKDSQVDFSHINDSANPRMVERWANEEAEAQQNRDEHEEAMGIFDIKTSKGQ